MDTLQTANAGEMSLLTRHPWVRRRLFDVTEYHQMGAAGILTENERIELIEGALVVMSPIGSPHAGTINILARLLFMAVREAAIVSVQNPVRLDDHSEPQPDLALLKPRGDSYQRSLAGPPDILLLIEVAATSLIFDRSVKVPLYARAGIRELWIVDIDAHSVEIYRSPSPDGYLSVTRQDRSGRLAPEALPDSSVLLAPLFSTLP